MPVDPVVAVLLSPTTVDRRASTAGTRIRAGNAMDRTRVALLAGARQAVIESGTRITMGQIATLAGVAKATLYNHFRTKESVLHALLLDEVSRIVDSCAGHPLAESLEQAATSIATNPVLSTLSLLEPGTVATMARVGASDGWSRARVAVHDVLDAEGRSGTDFVLRWLASYLVSPAEVAGDDVAVLITGLPAR